MALRASMLLPSTVTKSLVCIDEINNCEFSGRIFNPFMTDIKQFCSIKDFIDILDGFFNDIGFPQALFSERSFDEKKPEPNGVSKERNRHIEVSRHFNDEEFNAYNGRIASFVLQVQFRRNATWQGKLEWREADKRCDFRSILEFIRLLDDAVRKSTGLDFISSW